MQIFLGDTCSQKTLSILKKHNIGRMLTCKMRKLYPGEIWGFDNGAWVFHKHGIEFSFYETDCEANNSFLIRLNEALKIDHPPYLAVLPDIVGGGDRSLEISLSWIGNLPKWPWYLAVQDGMTVGKVIDNIHLVDGIFLGGTNDYKKYAGYWCKLAHHFGKKFHYGRAGTLSKLAHAILVKTDSIDSSFPLWTYNRLFSFIQALNQPSFDGLTIFAPHPNQGTNGHGALVEI